MTYILLAIILLSYSGIPTIYYRIKFFCKSKLYNNSKILCLTFDDGPHEVYTDKLLDLLLQYNIKATFFVAAKFAQNHPKLIERMKNEGHTIAFHSLEHKNPLIKSPFYTEKDFNCSINIMNNLNSPLIYFRPPWGCVNLTTIKNIKKYNLNLIFWNVMVGDWRTTISSNKIAKKLLKRTKVNHLICLHDGRGRNKAPLRTIRALEKTIPLWIEEGYTFVKIDDLIKTTITSN
ncbi:polysaccharide deacetylase [Clostridium bornimense]|uniref:Polysaccharide deacetylase n=1 Tax=Clostridium bornimense TaxID=1216932 RepID=W6S237_9CLOT|nr:polysaccharide deacetylase family protein [Clostridium bornimense]CDM69939.1 polysaccharide deacetylase [Clostridium bornimense]